MGLTSEQLQMAGLIDVRVKAMAKSGVDDLAIFTDMADYFGKAALNIERLAP